MSGIMGRSVSRRWFVGSTAAGALSLGVPYLTQAAGRTVDYAKGTSVHPNIDERRVVGVHDQGMTEGDQGRLSWEQQEKRVNWATVHENMDRMACALAGEKEPERAWEAIFLVPPQKSASQTTVAIKSNHQGVQRARSAVVSKLCHVLTDIVGVSGPNIVIYDACHGSGMAKNTAFRKLPEGVNLANRWGGFSRKVRIPSPYMDGSRRRKCLGPLARGKVDILIDVALSKQVMMWAGGFTQAMKNHFGTFNPKPAHSAKGHDDYLIAVNKTPQILGDIDSSSGKVLSPASSCVLSMPCGAVNPVPGEPRLISSTASTWVVWLLCSITRWRQN